MKSRRLPQPVIILLSFLAGVDTTLKALALRDLFQRERRVRGGQKAPWAAVIAAVNTLGWLTYFLFGRISPTQQATAEMAALAGQPESKLVAMRC